MAFAILGLALVAAVVLALREAKAWQWGLAALVIGLLALLRPEAGFAFTGNALLWIVALLLGAVLLLASIPMLRRAVLTGPAYGMVKAMLPRISRTEQEALDAGTVGSR